MMATLIQHIQSTMETQALLPRGSHVLVGVSGGADSVALLCALMELAEPLDLRISVAHLNHGIRPEAAADAHFVKALCQDLGVFYQQDEVDVPAAAKASGASLEMAAREARYAFFARVAAERGADVVATAHTRDDQAETVLLKLCRGAGTAGLRGIARQTVIENVRIIRPLLDCSREDVERFLNDRGQRWREDATNDDTQLRRNFVRHEVLPLLERGLNPRVKEALARTAELLGDEEALLATLTEQALEKAHDETDALQLAALSSMESALRRRVLQAWLIRVGIPKTNVSFDVVERLDAVTQSSNGSQTIDLASGQRVRREYDLLRVVDVATEVAAIPETELEVPGETLIPSAGLRITATLTEGFERNPAGPLGQFPCEAWIRWDADVPPALHVRAWRPGDRIQPVGLEGSCKLQDLFVDAKVPRCDRARIPVITSGDEVVWLPGHRIARKWALSHQKQRSLLLRVAQV
jgi:tRNA(Ile)-lysidine synthase